MTQRLIKSSFWSDPYIENLNPIEKMLYLYFLTNDKTNLIGIYELSIRRMAFQTGIESKKLVTILKKFEEHKKIAYKNSYVFILNFLKHQNLNNSNIKKGIEREYIALPEDCKEYARGIYETYKGHIRDFALNLTKLNLTKLSLSTESGVDESKESVIPNQLFSIEQCISAAEYEGYKKEEGEKFYNHYSAQGWKRGAAGLLITDLVSAFRSWIDKGKEANKKLAKESWEDKQRKKSI
jgi:hypothetical protein